MAAFGPELMLCAGDARIGPLRQRWWAVAEPGAPILERTSPRSAGMTLESAGAHLEEGIGATAQARLRIAASDLELDLTIGDGSAAVEPVEVVSPSGRAGWAWTRKQAGVPATGTLKLHGRRRDVELEAMIDDSAGYHERHTAWRWSTGVGRAVSGPRVAWNLVSGVHDAPTASERTVWVDGEAAEVDPVDFARDLSGLETAGGGALHFSPWAAREHALNLLVVRSAYRQPFGTFSGELPGGLQLAEGYGVMEEHDVRW